MISWKQIETGRRGSAGQAKQPAPPVRTSPEKRYERTPWDIVSSLTAAEREDLVNRLVEKDYKDGRRYQGLIVDVSDKSLKVKWIHNPSQAQWLLKDEGHVTVKDFASAEILRVYGITAVDDDEDEEEEEEEELHPCGHDASEYDPRNCCNTCEKCCDCEEEDEDMGDPDYDDDADREEEEAYRENAPPIFRFSGTPRHLAKDIGKDLLLNREFRKVYPDGETGEGRIVDVSAKSLKVRWNKSGNERWLKADEGRIFVY